MAANMSVRKAQLARAQKRVQIRARLINLRQKQQQTAAQIKAAREELKQV